jgi:predicted nucleotidyltransferase
VWYSNPDVIVSVADARENFSKILKTFRADPNALPVVLGAHRKPEAVIVPYKEYMAGRRVLMGGAGNISMHALGEMSDVLHKLAAMNNINDIAIFGPALTDSLGEDDALDMLVGPTEQATYFDVVQFATDIELVLRRFVNVVNRDGLHPLTDAQIIEEAVYI